MKTVSFAITTVLPVSRSRGAASFRSTLAFMLLSLVRQSIARSGRA